MLKKLLGVLGVVVAILVAAIAGGIGKEIAKSVFGPSKPTKYQVDTALVAGFQKAAAEMNSKLPMMVDDETRLNRATVGPGPRLVYHYSFPRYESRDVDVNHLRSAVRSEVTRKACSTASMKKSLQHGAMYEYSYSGSDNVEIARFQLNAADCGFALVTPR